MAEKQEIITEEMVEKYYELNKNAKEIERELAKLKKLFNQYFDLTIGKNRKGELSFNHYTLLRQIRISEKYREDEAVAKLEEMNLSDCIQTEKRVDKDKVKAATELGLLDESLLSPFKERKYSSVFYVKER